MVALSMADGYARLSGRPQCVIVHVDVGTQGLGAAVHDSCMGRCPVLIFAGLSPVTIEGEYRGSRTEYIHWIQDVPQQSQIVAQYMRYCGEIKKGRNVKQMVNRALSFAMSDPKGPVYLTGSREAMEEDIEPYKLDQSHWAPVEPAALPQSGVERIAKALSGAKEPLLITGSAGRNALAASELVVLANLVRNLRVLDTGGSDMSFPANHPAWLGMRYGMDPSVQTADVILVLECDTPWIPAANKPRDDALILHVDNDPLKRMMPTFYLNAEARYFADSTTALRQLTQCLKGASLQKSLSLQSSELRDTAYRSKLAQTDIDAQPNKDESFGTACLARIVREACPINTTFVIEAVTNAGIVHDQLQLSRPKSWINCGGGGLGWSGGAALGVKLAADDLARASNDTKPSPFVCQIVGDGTYLFSVPSSVYWIAQRYKIPVLTVVLNNKGWQAPRKSALLVHPEGEASRASAEDINISFAPSPDYAGIAKAAAGGRLWAGRAGTVPTLKEALADAVKSVQAGVGAVLDAHLDGGEGAYVVDQAVSSG